MADFSAIDSRTTNLLLTERTFPSSSNHVCLPKALLETFPKVPVTQADLQMTEQRRLRAIQDSDKSGTVPSKLILRDDQSTDWLIMHETFNSNFRSLLLLPDNKVNFKLLSNLYFKFFYSQLIQSQLFLVMNLVCLERSSLVLSSQLEDNLYKIVISFDMHTKFITTTELIYTHI